MKVYYMDQVLELSSFENNEKISQINRVFASLYENNEIVQEVSIDNRTYREGYEAEILNNLDRIKEIKIGTVNGAVFVEEMLQELGDYLPRLNRAIESISDLFYGEMTTEDWNLFSQLLEGMSWVEQASNILLEQFRKIEGYEQLASSFLQLKECMPGLLTELEEALSREERVAAGDIVKYELGEIFTQLEQALHARVVV
jgi:hypothetical protein